MTTLCASCLIRAFGDFLVALEGIFWPFGAEAFGVSGEGYRKATDVFSYIFRVKGDSPSMRLADEDSVGEATFENGLNWLYRASLDQVA